MLESRRPQAQEEALWRTATLGPAPRDGRSQRYPTGTAQVRSTSSPSVSPSGPEPRRNLTVIPAIWSIQRLCYTFGGDGTCSSELNAVAEESGSGASVHLAL
jgi:hypothetical protein